MDEHYIVFTADSQSKIVIESQEPLDQIHAHYIAVISFVYEGRRFELISDEKVRDNLVGFRKVLMEALNQTKYLDTSFQGSFGSLYHESLFYRNKKRYLAPSYLVFKTVVSDSSPTPWYSWVGEDYKFWGYGNYTMSLYPTSDGTIFFEASPPVRYFNREDVDVAELYTYLENYHPVLLVPVARSVVQRWLEQTEFLLKTIKDNIERFAEEAYQIRVKRAAE